VSRLAPREPDHMLRRIERTALLWCVAAAGVAAVARGGRFDVSAGVLGGGLLVGLSYWGTKAWVSRLAGAAATAEELASGRGRRAAWGRRALRAGWLVGRYALLAFLAYVMMSRLRLHPVGLVLGASSVVAAAAIEAVRTIRS
jgi:hypothetical protein